MFSATFHYVKTNRTCLTYESDRPDLISGAIYPKKDCFPRDQAVPRALIVEVRDAGIGHVPGTEPEEL